MKTRRSNSKSSPGTKKVTWNLEDEIAKIIEKGVELGVDLKSKKSRVNEGVGTKSGGLGKEAKRRKVKSVVLKHNPTVLFIQESKLASFDDSLIRGIDGVLLSRGVACNVHVHVECLNHVLPLCIPPAPPAPPSGSLMYPSGTAPPSGSLMYPSGTAPPSGALMYPSGTAPPSGSLMYPSGTAPPSGALMYPSGTAPPSGSLMYPSGTTPPSGALIYPSGTAPPSGALMYPSGTAPPSGSLMYPSSTAPTSGALMYPSGTAHHPVPYYPPRPVPPAMLQYPHTYNHQGYTQNTVMDGVSSVAVNIAVRYLVEMFGFPDFPFDPSGGW
ncbi:hypothetical protein LWI28_024712 [Acer negundo]|uniref:Uncharacterized protein n=1 Tax=Acer negundo TaxID=4023 RepID=A0AAD5IAN1_ACENE|nr:hypothetical protein LWI28_024712 [Acer negundo]